MKKKPWLAALLNVLLTGVGYIYNGKRVAFGVMLLIGEILIYYTGFSDLTLFSNPIVLISGFIWTFALGFDAYQEAKNI